MGASNGSSDDGIHDINVTPMVDVTLVLLVIFMVTAKLISSPAIPLDLPAAATGGETQTILHVGVDAEGRVTVDGEPTDEAALERVARQKLAEDPELRAVIAASRRSRHGAVIGVLDALRGAGLDRVGFAVEPEP